MEGWIKIHRKILNWEWYTDTNTKCLFIHLLLKANYEDGRWKGIEIKRGQVLTGRKNLSKETGLSEKEIRTALEHLKTTNEVAIKTTNLYSIIELKNYDLYQQNGQQIDQQRAKEGPTKGHKQEELRTKEEKEDNNIYHEIISYLNLKANTKYQSNSKLNRKHINARINDKFTLNDFKKVIDSRCSQWINDPKMKEYLRPETLFGNKFEGYLNSCAVSIPDATDEEIKSFNWIQMRDYLVDKKRYRDEKIRTKCQDLNFKAKHEAEKPGNGIYDFEDNLII